MPLPPLGIFGRPAIKGDYDSIATVTVGSGGSATVEFTSIPGTYKHLQLRIAGLAGSADAYLNFNGDSTATNYYNHQLYGNGTAVSAFAYNNRYIDAGGTSNTYPAVYVIDILDYTNTNKYKTIRDLWGYDYNGSGRVGLNSILWSNTAAITSISITNRTWSQYSHFALYGIK